MPRNRLDSNEWDIGVLPIIVEYLGFELPEQAFGIYRRCADVEDQ